MKRIQTSTAKALHRSPQTSTISKRTYLALKRKCTRLPHIPIDLISILHTKTKNTVCRLGTTEIISYKENTGVESL